MTRMNMKMNSTRLEWKNGKEPKEIKYIIL